MKTLNAVSLAIGLALALPALADSGTYPQSITGEGVSVKTRTQVVAEMSEIVPVAEAPVKTRAQVRAELFEARRLGLLSKGEGEFPQATAAQERLIELAGKRALEYFATTGKD